ncbi:MerR family transcriptional regulator [Amycolatopsis sp. K13G38]|uniref:MerR family transcriptional regulator n=1 Tax=Amycolatopsis acididurans TaxID=2724524 RepID=A0ABX1IZJ2_9PSEU|nr:MerR family transcriptional regulator [Amycolatopsis acididurans]NKQ52769.1 MerR family transcriptional regulator [Amycolatopsis acididurans]
MTNSGLLTIGAFARATGLTASALRFYDDSGLLPPAGVDESSGYRYYAPAQAEQARAIRRLREIGLPLGDIATVLASGGEDASRIIDGHVAALADHARRARETAATLKASLPAVPARPSVCLGGAVFTAAIDQILTAATPDQPELPVLNGVRIEVSAEAIVLTATDRYWLSTRTLVPGRAPEQDWAATVDADDLRLALPWARRRHRLRLSLAPGTLRLDGDEDTRECRTLSEPFPDYRRMLASLPAMRTRVVLSRNALLRRLEALPGHRARLETGAQLLVSGEPVAAAVTGPAIGIEFDVTVLYPAISTALGPDVMLDLAAPDQPVVVRSADDGDLTTVAMPVAPEGSSR